MYCSCGNTISEKSHTVKTVKGASGWVDVDVDVDKDKLPFKVLQAECGSCGRTGWKVWDAGGELVGTQG